MPCSRYDGTAGLTGSLGMGDLTDVEIGAQQAVTQWTAGVPGWAVLGLVALVASYVAWRRAHPKADQAAPTSRLGENRAGDDVARR